MSGNTNAASAPAQIERLTYTAQETAAALGISQTTLWRLEKRGLITAVPGIRHKLYSVDSLRRFVAGKARVTP